jgi:hypothetical protein
MISDSVVTDAVISDCGRFRYLLTRQFASVDGPAVTFIMLNPSTADAANDDPTIRHCMAYARRWGRGSLCVVNLFALRSTSSREISECAAAGVDPRGPDNMPHIRRACATGEVVCAWGNYGAFERAGASMIEWLSDEGVKPLALRMTRAGHPAHPLYLPSDLQPLPLSAFL